jgi:hypothetical protein
MDNLLRSVKKLKERHYIRTDFESKIETPSFLVLTAGAYNYKLSVLNWIEHMHILGLHNYIVLCFDEKICEIVGKEHGVLMNFGLGIKVSNGDTLFQENTSIDGSLTSQINGGKKLRSKSKQTRHTPKLRSPPPAFPGENPHRVLQSHSHSLWEVLVETFEILSSTFSELVHSTSLSTSTSLPTPTVQSQLGKRFINIHINSEFAIMMAAKYAALNVVLETGLPVVWSDADCVWLKPCVVQIMQQHATPRASQ